MTNKRITIKNVYELIAIQPKFYDAISLCNIYKHFKPETFEEKYNLSLILSKLEENKLIHQIYIEGKTYFLTFERKNINYLDKI